MNENGDANAAKYALLQWCQMRTSGYAGVKVVNLTGSWRNGLAFNALLHSHRPDLISYETLQPRQHRQNLNNAFDVANTVLGVPKILDAEALSFDWGIRGAKGVWGGGRRLIWRGLDPFYSRSRGFQTLSSHHPYKYMLSGSLSSVLGSRLKSPGVRVARAAVVCTAWEWTGVSSERTCVSNVDRPDPDENSIATYLTSMYHSSGCNGCNKLKVNVIQMGQHSPIPLMNHNTNTGALALTSTHLQKQLTARSRPANCLLRTRPAASRKR
uniref:Calponin-homology (CH) domain-containing protein n=1 Tax=Timema shepardi TaxID=629360 RepID=A0A7R9B507_TIMSH|nr:unnamed protein product [Timema shepardi]